MTALLGTRALARYGPSRILYDLRSSRAVPQVLQEAGGEPIKTRVGHAFVKAQMRELEATCAGEFSYHFSRIQLASATAKGVRVLKNTS